MLPANLAKTRASTRGASYGEFILIPAIGAAAAHAAPTSIRYTPYAIPIASAAATHSSSLSGSRTHHILSTLEHTASPYLAHKNVFGVITNHTNPAQHSAGITINPSFGLTMLPIQAVGI
jgi:hypothetical protein